MSTPHEPVSSAPRDEDEPTGPMIKGILTDITKCIGCERCVDACAEVNELPLDIPAFHKSPDGLSSDRYCSIVDLDGPEGPGSWRSIRRQCMHCLEPNCAAACLVGAFTKEADGSVRYDPSKCIGCRYCMLACPFGVPRYEYGELLPLMTKCKMNEECRVEGGMPACVSICPTEATIFGPREKLLEEAHRRIEDAPDKYIDHVYGEHEFGGTSVIYISDAPLNDPLMMPSDEGFDKLHLPHLKDASIAHLLHKWVMFTPIQFLGVGSALSGLWFFRRRKLVAAHEAGELLDQIDDSDFFDPTAGSDDIPRPTIRGWVKDLLWALTVIAVVVGSARFFVGLGAATNMTDALPWGFWKIFNMVAGAALATSGFMVAAIIYILQLNRYRSIARLSVVIGFLGYGASLAALMFDIGLPQRGWHAFFMWNPHSFLFEVFWCVSVYWSITALELLPLLTERFPYKRLTHLLHEVMLPFVVLGVTLSSMHHSSLGSLFMASPTRLHPLWFSLWIPPEFLISAMGGGLSTIVLIKLVIDWLYERKTDMGVVGGLAKASAVCLGLYLLLKAADFTYFDKWSLVFGPDVSWESQVFLVEISLQAILPSVLLAIPAVRRSPKLLGLATSMALVGVIMHRMNTGITGYFRTAHATYMPNLSELLFGIGVFAAAGLAFLFLVEHFYVLDEPAEQGDKAKSWTLAEARRVFLGARARRVAWMSLVLVPLTVYGFRNKGTGSFTPTAQPVEASVQGDDELRTVLMLDADGDGDGVRFPHDLHKEIFAARDDIEEDDTCVSCHHLDLPDDHNSPCRDCHSDMEIPQPMFSLARHEERFEDAAERAEFLSHDLSDRLDNFAACFHCHEDDPEMPGLASYEKRGFDQLAPGFRNAMHGSCLSCHRREDDDKTDAMSLGNCKGCHATDDDPDAARTVSDAHAAVDDGDEAMLKGEITQAEASYREAIRIDPDHPTTPLYKIGVLLNMVGREAEARAVLLEASTTEGHRDARRARELLGQMAEVE